jgi:Transmembrane domain of unknown function (DUF3566)
MAEHVQGQPGADRAVGRPGPAARMTGPDPVRPRPSVLIPPVTSAPSSAAAAAAAAPPAAAPAPSAPIPPTAAPSAATAPPTVAPVAAAAVATGVAASTSPAPAPAGQAMPVARQQPQPRPPQPSVARVARSAVRPSSGPRAARVYLTHVDPWSVMKQAFLLSLALAVIILAASAALWFALDSAGIIDAITRTATDVGGESGASVTGFLDFGKIMGAALVVAGIETVLVTAFCTLLAFMYNLSVGIGGGLEVTLSEED